MRFLLAATIKALLPFLGLLAASCQQVAPVVVPIQSVRNDVTLELRSGGVFVDPHYGVSARVPAGWRRVNSQRSGERETILGFQDPAFPRVSANFSYRMLSPPLTNTGPGIEAWLRDQMDEKQRQRLVTATDYVNGPARMRTIRNRPALTWNTDYTRNGERFTEHLTRVYSPNCSALFFINGPAAEVQQLLPQFEAMIASAIVP